MQIEDLARVPRHRLPRCRLHLLDLVVTQRLRQILVLVETLVLANHRVLLDLEGGVVVLVTVVGNLRARRPDLSAIHLPQVALVNPRRPPHHYRLVLANRNHLVDSDRTHHYPAAAPAVLVTMQLQAEGVVALEDLARPRSSSSRHQVVLAATKTQTLPALVTRHQADSVTQIPL